MKAITKTIIASAMLSSTLLFTSCVSAEERQERKFQKQLRAINDHEYGMATWDAVDAVTFIDHTNNDQIITIPKYNTSTRFVFNDNSSDLIDLYTQGGSLNVNDSGSYINGNKFFYGLPGMVYNKVGKVSDYQLNVNYEGTIAINYPHLQGYAQATNVPIKVTGTVKFLNFSDDPNIYTNARAEVNLRYTTTSDSITVRYNIHNPDNPATALTGYLKVKDHRDFTQKFIARP